MAVSYWRPAPGILQQVPDGGVMFTTRLLPVKCQPPASPVTAEALYSIGYAGDCAACGMLDMTAKWRSIG